MNPNHITNDPGIAITVHLVHVEVKSAALSNTVKTTAEYNVTPYAHWFSSWPVLVTNGFSTAVPKKNIIIEWMNAFIVEPQNELTLKNSEFWPILYISGYLSRDLAYKYWSNKPIDIGGITVKSTEYPVIVHDSYNVWPENPL
ncbi:hypothetical protein AYI69_g8541 [Smittium culicis]|uniref:Uncharacterized protein n=1 Tax=Smittium culicis TaxID=133412 RepID=A0A1R1XJ04_9FUNG|nr:hypothetical protein AYI69_g8541 [Smittium culicis]